MDRRLRIIIFFTLAITATVLLATSLTGVQFSPGKALPFSWEEFEVPQASAAIPGGEATFNIFRAIYFLVWLLFPILVIILIISPEARKAFFKQAIRILPFILLILLAGRFIQNLTANQGVEGEGAAGAPQMGLAYPGPQETFEPASPSWAVWGVSLALAVLIVVVFLVVLWFFWSRRRKETGMAQIAAGAQNALDELEKGANLRNVVMRCYYEMSQVISETRGIKRGADLTPQEFQSRLLEKGLPREPVSSLTSLFEEVRYGTKTPGKYEEQRAVESLTAIVNYCQPTGHPGVEAG